MKETFYKVDQISDEDLEILLIISISMTVAVLIHRTGQCDRNQV